MNLDTNPFFRSQIIDMKVEGSKLQLVISPVELNFGNVIGNLIRRILIKQIPSFSIIGYKLDRLSKNHSFIKRQSLDEFSDFEDSLTRVRICEKFDASSSNLLGDLSFWIKGFKQGPNHLYAGDLVCPDNFEILNQELCLFEIPYGVQFEYSLLFRKGIGFILSKSHKGLPKGMVGLDSYFNPIVHVSYHVNTYSLYEDLILYLETDGRISPKVAYNYVHLFFQSKFGLIL
uniref:RNA polymerase subunit alpha n=1 Tax=Jakoba bahamiensis TaxID=221721 RepID=M4Q9S4_9EUKA|nr:RNA polymerase subunit alpha [Jakoba bahamiensis]AGH24167.1 RNA polymerase subunit alpha [Jakoba bahamiensis]